MPPIPTVWWLRPLSRAARVGEHSAVVWKRVYFRPSAARRSNVGVWGAPPNALLEPKPASSMRMMSTFGAPSGGRIGSIGGKAVSGSFASYVVTPVWARAGIGRIARLESLIPTWAILLAVTLTACDRRGPPAPDAADSSTSPNAFLICPVRLSEQRERERVAAMASFKLPVIAIGWPSAQPHSSYLRTVRAGDITQIR